jgi:2-polyprenyl-6-methoxyphenol hydroxylase-like FAD-dependent oxidoreductase
MITCGKTTVLVLFWNIFLVNGYGFNVKRWFQRGVVPPLAPGQPFDKTSPVVVLGGGPCGLTSAVMLARRGYSNISVIEKLPEPAPCDDAAHWNDYRDGQGDRFYNIGINGRGQKTLKKLGLMDLVDEYAFEVAGRIDWSPETPAESPKETIFTGKSYKTKCIQRDRLVSCLLRSIRTNSTLDAAISVQHGLDCVGVTWDSESSFGNESQEGDTNGVILELQPSSDPSTGRRVESSFIIGTDGGNSFLRDAMRQEDTSFQAHRFEDTNVRVYKTVPLNLPVGWKRDINYSCRTKSGINLDALPTKEGKHLAVLLFRPWDKRVTGLKDTADARTFFEEHLPQFAPMLNDADLEVFVQRPHSRFPQFSYTGPRLSFRRATVLLGDAIKTVKPYFGQGVNSAFEDVCYLDQELERACDDIPRAIQAFSDTRAPDVKALVHISRRLDGGFFSFVLPLIVDSIFNKLSPSLFKGNIISLLQKEELRFAEVLWIKRRERVLQALVVSSAMAAVYSAVRQIFTLGLRLLRPFASVPI